MLFWFERHSKLSWVITIFIAITIFYISSLIFPPVLPTGAFDWKPIAYHFYSFLFLEAFLLISITRGKNENKKFFFIAIIIAIFYAVLDEIHQIFVLGRACTFSDFLIDSTGILFVGLLYSLLRFNNFREGVPEEYKKSLYY